MKQQRTFGDIERFGRYIWRYKLTGTGRALVVTGIVAGLIGHPIQLPILYTFFALFALGFVALVVNALLRPRLEITGSFPQLATAEQPVTGWFTIANRARRPAYDLAAGYFATDPALDNEQSPPAHPRLAPGERVSLPITVRASRRGAYHLPPLCAYSTFPFSICRAGRKAALGSHLLVAPSFHPLTGIDVPIGRRYQPGGIALTSDVGESPEYIGNREYRPGDSPRRIDFKSWARHARPVVREYQEEFYCRIALVLDTFVAGKRRRPRAGFPQFEAAVSLSASIADALAHGEYIIDLFAAGPELYVFRAGRHTAHFENILEILACVDECRDDPFDVVTPALADELTRISTVICVFLDWDARREAMVRSAVEAGCDAKVIVVRDGATTLPPGDVENLTGLPAVLLSVAAVQRGGIERL